MMKVYGHPWSINTRKTLMTLAEKGREAELVTVVIPKGEQKLPAHLALHPFAKVPVLEDDGFVLYETSAINRYLDRTLGGVPLTPAGPREAARLDQWINVADAYFIPHVMPLIVESLFRRYLGGAQDRGAIEAGRAGMQGALDVADRWLGEHACFAGEGFSLADIHWMPYVEYLQQIGEGEAIERRPQLRRWWQAVSGRPSWQRVARTGPQPYQQG
jgi:glutathione S-transferase